MSGLAKVTITRGNGNLTPTAGQNDGETLMVIAAPSGAWDSVIPGVYSSYAEYYTKTKAYPDSVVRAAVSQHVRHFFLNSSGQKLHVLLVAQAQGVTLMTTPAETSYVAMNNYLIAQNGKIKTVALIENLTDAFVIGAKSTLITTTTVTQAQTFANLHAAAGRPIHIIIGSLVDYSIATIEDFRALSSPSVSVHLFRHSSEATALVAEFGTASAPEVILLSRVVHTGYVAGMVAGQPVQRNIGRVLNGSITDKLPGTVYHSTNNPRGKEDAYTDAGLIIPVQHPGKDGYFFNDDPACTLLADDFNSISRNRVINKAETIAREIYTNRLNSEVDIDPTTGKISPIAAKAFESEVETALVQRMVNKGECVAVQVYVDPDQDVLTTSTLDVTVAVLPKGHVKYINVLVKFTQTITA